MRDGRLYAVAYGPERLFAFQYDATAITLVDILDYAGRSSWPVDAVDLGSRLIVVSPEAIEVIAPACLP